MYGAVHVRTNDHVETLGTGAFMELIRTHAQHAMVLNYPEPATRYHIAASEQQPGFYFNREASAAGASSAEDPRENPTHAEHCKPMQFMPTCVGGSARDGDSHCTARHGPIREVRLR